MKPQFCWLCGRDFRAEWFHSGDGGELVRFRDYGPLPVKWVGHPQGLEWFCREHACAARELAHLEAAAALAELQRRFGMFPMPQPSLAREPSLWVTEVGPNLDCVFAVVREASGWPATEVLARLRAVPFELALGWPESFEAWRAALVAAGAGVEVRYD